MSRQIVTSLALLLLIGCGAKQTETSNPSPPENQSTEPGHLYLDQAQTGLPETKLWLGPAEITAELATTTTQIATGLMHRESMDEERGMLFLFARPHQASFYMRNTILPLSIAYLDSEGAIIDIHKAEPMNETPLTASTSDIQFVLEMNQGWFERNQVSTGAVVKTSSGSLTETFFSGRFPR